MPMNCITKDQQLAVEAKLNMLLGAAEYDRLFMEFQLMELQWGILSVRVKSEHLAPAPPRPSDGYAGARPRATAAWRP